ncbi:unnamed protein product [Brachionus calyciflorus]|uniref:Uncharacterized protein n=1 Tax=Brachionus calyciflorus TaxID=104777 RepID=A0A813MB20_9BILA|nr:unnamed protein product [Brachionus calyciflorus]
MGVNKKIHMPLKKKVNRLPLGITAGTIQATILTTRSGEYLDYDLRNDLHNQSVSSSSLNQSQTNQINFKSLCAIICSVYQSYQKLSHAFADNLNYVIIDCDMYRLAIRS